MPPRFHVDDRLQAGAVIELPASAARHVQVLRLQPGAPITLFDGEGGEWDARVDEHRPQRGRRSSSAHTMSSIASLPLAVTLAIGMPANERMDTLVEKATELGVAAIQPLLTERSVLRLAGERARAPARTLAGDRGRGLRAMRAHARAVDRAGAVAESRGLPTANAAWPRCWLLSPIGDAPPLAEQSLSQRAVQVLSGPEGGLSSTETAAARAAGFCRGRARPAHPARRHRAARRARLRRARRALSSRRAGHQVEAKQAAFDRPVPQRDAPAFLEAHHARQLHVRTQHPRGPAGRVRRVGALPVARQARKEIVGRRALFAVGATPALPRTSMRSPYGGLSINVPGRSVGQRGRRPLERVAAVELDRLRDAGTLGVAAREVDHAKGDIARKDRHRARMDALPSRASSSAATARAIRVERNGASRSNAKRRCSPGAMPQAICAASIAIVPEPQHGSCSAPPASGVPRQPAAASIAAASVSFSGASPLSSRQPRLNSGSPDVSTYNVGALGPEVQHELQVGALRVDTRPLAACLAQRVAHGVLDAQRREVQAAQRRAVRGGVDAQRLARRDPGRPVDAARERVEVVFVAVGAFGDFDQHALREAAFEVEPHHALRVALQAPRRRAPCAAARRAAASALRRRASLRPRPRRAGTL